ncbi:MAG: group I truncated hemoglobin [Pyrinomonadaceae bacterium]
MKQQKDMTIGYTVRLLIAKFLVGCFATVIVVSAGAQFASGQENAANANRNPATTAPKIISATSEKSLYERLGGYDAISAVVETFADKLFADPRINAFFKGMGTDTRKQFKQKNKSLICNVTGGPCKIISRSAKETHTGLGITEKDFGIVAQHLVDTLNEFKVPEREQKELIAIIESLRPDIVEKK